MSSRKRGWARVVGQVAGGLLVAGSLAGCGEDESPEPAPPPPPVDVPSGVELTPEGSTTELGEPQTIVFKPPSGKRTVLTVTIDKVVRGQISDLREFELSAIDRKSRPFYVRATVRNRGPAALKHPSAPIYALDSSNTYFGATEIRGDFKRCDDAALPRVLRADQRDRGCFVFLVPKGLSLEQIQVRADDLDLPVSWTL